MIKDLVELTFVILLMSCLSSVFILFSYKYNFLKKLSKPIPNLLILATYIILVRMDYYTLPFKYIASSLIGPVLGSFIVGNFAILIYYKFNLKNFSTNYFNLLSTSFTIPLLIYLIAKIFIN